MAELKTRPTDASVTAFLDAVPDEQRRRDCYTVLEIMQQVTGAQPVMWGDSIVGFGTYYQKYANGKELDWPLTGFSPRKQSLTIYIMSGFTDYEGLTQKLGKHTTSKACLYVKRLSEIDLDVLRELIAQSVEYVRKITGTT